jgi:hypothetical protein
MLFYWSHGFSGCDFSLQVMFLSPLRFRGLALKENPAALDAVLRALGELQTSALAKPGVELTDAALINVAALLSLNFTATNTQFDDPLMLPDLPDAAQTLPFLVIRDSTTSEELESDLARLSTL